MLVDDNQDDNFFHEREIKKSSLVNTVVTKNTGADAITYLKDGGEDKCIRPELIFLDINMPGMNGWEFLEQYHKLDAILKNQVIIIMLTTSDNPDDKTKASKWDFVSDYITKPLTKEMIAEIVKKYFKS